MKVLTTLTVSGGLNMASAAKDVFTIGTPLENNDGNVDDLYVYANADFKNNVILGSSSVDVVDIKAQITASNGMTIVDSSLYLTGSSTIYYQGQDFVNYVFNNIGGGGGYAESAVVSQTQSYEPYGGGTGSYFSGTVVRDALGAGQNASINIGHISASDYNINSDIIDIAVNQSRVRVTENGIDFNFGTSSLSIDQIYSAVYGGGAAITSLESTGSGESLIREINNGTAYLRTLKSTPTINVNQQTNELELEVNSNLVLTSLRSEGWLTVSGNVQLGDQSTDVTTVTGQLTASAGIEVAGNIVPTTSASYSLGSLTKPFKEIFVGSGSISIAAPIAGVAATTISNNSGNLDISAGGVRLVGTGSFIGNGSELTNILATNTKHNYTFLTSSGQSASFVQSIVYLNDGNNAQHGLPDINGFDGHLITLKNLKNTNATIRAYTGQTINGTATHTIAGNATEIFHATSGSRGAAWYTILSSLAFFLTDAWQSFGLI